MTVLRVVPILQPVEERDAIATIGVHWMTKRILVHPCATYR